MKPDSATVLVAGTTGRTGRLLVRTLLAAGFTVRALCRPGESQSQDNGKADRERQANASAALR